MDHLQTRLETLEQQMHTVNRRLRWWRGLACGLGVLGLLTWSLPSGTAQEDTAAESLKEKKGLAHRVAALEDLLKHFTRVGDEVRITGANLHIRNGIGSTDCLDEQFDPIPDCPNGLGNLIVGYNEPREPDFGETIRTGSHNVVVGQEHNFSRFGGVVVGVRNTISGDFSSVTAGAGNTASGPFSSITAGSDNTASGLRSSVSGGGGNIASGEVASISAGRENIASGQDASVSSGGGANIASGDGSSVSGGNANIASGNVSSVSGGSRNTASGLLASVSGGGNFFPEVGNTASGDLSSVTGGSGNTASGSASSVNGGRNITQETEFGWAAGSEGDEVFVGNFRSP